METETTDSYWKCIYHDSNGIRCKNHANFRLHYASAHPFEHVDVCEEHKKEFRDYIWIQKLEVD